MSRFVMERFPSVPDDELFGDGNHVSHDTEQYPMATFQQATGERSDSMEQPENLASVKGATFAGCIIPNFDMLTFSESLSSNDSIVQLPSTFIRSDRQVKQLNYINESDSHMKSVLISRSISEASGKQRYASEDGFCPEPPEPLLNVPFRKSNSLPDLILSSSISSLSLRASTSSYGADSSPDVILADPEPSLKRKKDVRESFEGQSIMNMTKEGNGKRISGNICQLPKRSVSFSGNNKYIDEEPFVQSVPLEPADRPQDTGKHNTLYQVTDAEVNEMKFKGKALILHKYGTTSRQNSKESFSSQTPSVPTTPEGRRQLYSTGISSGYHTGSEESQDKGQSGISNMSDETFKWNSSKDGNPEIHSEYKLGINIVNEERTDSDEKYSPVNSSNSSVNTVIENPHSVTMKGSVIPNTTYGGAGRKHQSNDRNKKVLQRSNSAATDDGFEEGLPSLSMEDRSIEHTQRMAIEFKQSQRSLSSTQSSFGQINGNMPNIVDDSFQLHSSMLDKVDEEDKEQRDKVIMEYCSISPAVPGTGSVVSTRNITSLPDGGKNVPVPSKAGPESLPTGGQSLMQVQSGPRSQDVKGLERIILQGIEGNTDFYEIYHLLRARFAGSDSSTPSPSPLYTEAIEQICQTAPGACSPKLFTTTDLEKASRCTVSQCPDPSCKKKREIDSLLASVTTGDDSAIVKDYCVSLWQHGQCCSDCKCPVTYCNLMQAWFCNDVVRQIKLLQQNPVLNFQRNTDKNFVQLHDSVPDVVPSEYVTYTPLSVLGRYGAAVLAVDARSTALCILKEYPLFEYGHQGEVYRRLRNLGHVHLVQPLWLLEYVDGAVIHVCSQFMSGGSLKDHLCKVGMLSWPLTVVYMRQITSALCYLQAMGIVYLYWQSENMYFPDTRKGVIKVGNFSLSCPVDHQTIDLGTTKECLPYNICPPELLSQQSRIVKKSDVWGAGCLLAEMLTGLPVWHNLRHNDRDTVHMKIRQEFPKVDLPPGDQSTVLYSCWQHCPERRKTMDELENYFTAAHSRLR